MDALEEAIQNYYHRTKKSPRETIVKAEQKIQLLNKTTTVFIWFKGHCVEFVSLDVRQITFRNAYVLLVRKREHFEFEHLCMLLLRSQIVSRK